MAVAVGIWCSLPFAICVHYSTQNIRRADDIEFIPLKPSPANAATLAGIAARWPGRGLRSVGVIGLCGVTPCCALKEPLEPEQVSVLTDAFLAYLHALYCDRIAVHLEQSEIQELQRMWSLNDPRIEA